MHIVLVDVRVKPEFIDAFREATLENVRNSIREPGIVRFDFLQQADDPVHFVLFEVYHSAEDQHLHRGTTHYLVWRERVADMMAGPRVGTRYNNIFPEDQGWG
jgi:autoinducer 2-degrading protein